MDWQLELNDHVLTRGDFKSLNMLFDCLSGTSFAKGARRSWLDKMSATESYEHYLAIKAKEYQVEWQGTLSLRQAGHPAERVHLFAQHEQLAASTGKRRQTQA